MEIGHLTIHIEDLITEDRGRRLNPNKLVPVMIYIHGGAFMRGSSGIEMYGPDFLLQRDIVLFTFNYRLGAFVNESSYAADYYDAWTIEIVHPTRNWVFVD
uniref:carboxylesterase n=1 Tax=Phlebotomus papatasi TaxID=29031 RepID=A0A1B0DHD6_PHLPP